MFNRPNSASKNFMLAAAIWIVLGVLMGLTLALEFVFPDMFRGVPWLVFSRLRQAHTNTVMFAFLSGGMIGLWLYIVPQLTGRRLWSEALGNICMFLWNLFLIIGIVGLLNAQSQSSRIRRDDLDCRCGGHGRFAFDDVQLIYDHH